MFDVSHMGEFEVRGADAEKFLNKMTTNNVAQLEPGNIQYSAMLYDDGGVVDDLLVYRFDDHFMTVVNASNLQKDYDWLAEHISGDVQLKNVSDETALLAIQGPNALKIVANLADVPVDDIAYYNFRLGKIAGFDPHSTSAVADAAKLTCPVYLIHGALDFSVPVSDSEAIFLALNGPRKLKIVVPAVDQTAIILRGVSAWEADLVENLAKGNVEMTTKQQDAEKTKAKPGPAEVNPAPPPKAAPIAPPKKPAPKKISSIKS